MHTLPWQEIDPEDVPRLVAEINREIKDKQFDPVTTVARKQDLPFYAEYELIEFVDTKTSNPTLKRRALYRPVDYQI